MVGSVDRASEGAAKECEALLDELESLSVLLADALLVDEGAAVDEAVVATAGILGVGLIASPNNRHQPNE